MGHIESFIIGVMASITATLSLKFIIEKYSARLSWNNVFKDIMNLYNKIKKDNFSPDYIVAIDRNGSIIGSILAGHFGIRTVIAIATKTVRNTNGTRETSIIEAHLPQENILSGKKFLIIIGFNYTGTSLDLVYKHIESLTKGQAEIRTAAFYTSASPKLLPKYFAKMEGKDFKIPLIKIHNRMPWMSKDWIHVLPEERIIKSP